MANSFIVRKFGLCEYQQVWQKMREFTEKRDATTCDELWVLEHYHVFTQGRSGKSEHLLDPGDVPVIQTDRGGQITYHGPGQLIIYPLFDLKRAKFGVKQFVNLLEQTIIDTLAEYGIVAMSKPDAPGVYIKEVNIDSHGSNNISDNDEILNYPNKINNEHQDLNTLINAKICSLGLRIYRGCSYHGLALNVTTDLNYFKRINPCGFKNLKLANMSDMVTHLTTATGKAELEETIIRLLAQYYSRLYPVAE